MHKEKLSHVIARSDPFLSTRHSTFQEAFPMIATVTVEVIEKPLRGQSSTTTMTEKNFRQAVNCSNPKCSGGGVDVGRLLALMVARGQRYSQSTEVCRGSEPTPKGGRSCPTLFAIDIHLEYKSGPV